jgi:hypothetical protein
MISLALIISLCTFSGSIITWVLSTLKLNGEIHVVNKVLKRHGSYIESFKIMGSVQADSDKSFVAIAIDSVDYFVKILNDT